MWAARPWPAAVLVLAALLLGLALRLAWSAWTQPVPPYFSDAEYYDAAARSLARGQGYSVLVTGGGFLPGGEATAFFPPGYSFFLAAVYRLFGESFAAARAANVAVGALTVIPAYLAGRRLFGSDAALLGAAATAVFPSLVLWTPVLLSETLFAFLFAVGLTLAVYAARARGQVSMSLAAASGIAAGIAILVRGPALVLVPVTCLWWWRGGASLRSALLAGALAMGAALLVLLPWSLRNAAVFDAPVLLSTNLGYNLRVGHAPYATGRFIDPADLAAEAAPNFQELERLHDREGRRRAVEFAFAHPLREVELSLLKVRWLWSPDDDGLLWTDSFGRTPLRAEARTPVRLAVIAGHWLALALAGCALLGRRRYASALLLACLLSGAWTAFHVAFFGEPRYHLPLLPLLLPAAAAGLLEVAERTRRLRTTARRYW